MPNSKQAAVETFRTAVERAPLGVYQSIQQTYSMIPASIEPLVLGDSLWRSVQNDAGLILSALEKVGTWLRLEPQNSLFVNLSPLEREKADFGGLATARLDLFFDGDNLLVIEANTTIPAMQAYSDMVKKAFLQAFRPAENSLGQSNTQDLLISLLQHYERTGGTKQNPRISIVARAGDSQLAELLWLQKSWQEQGYETLLVTPDAMAIKSGQLWAQSQPIDLTYRHIFAHRLPRASAFAEACLKSETFRVFNPIAAHLEAKGVLAELSRMAADPELSRKVQLSDSEREATLRRVAWSRLLQRGSTLSPDLDPIPDLVSWVKERQDALVVKSSLGYGGHAVFIGTSFDETAAQERACQLLGISRALSWSDFIDYLQQQSEGQWIVQKKVSGRKVWNRFLIDGKLIERETFIDCSIFTSSGIPFKPSGGTCRFSSDAIVNIGQGGGLMPLLLESEL